ncbi:LytR/AlgR family response regulator transcription factor [Romboutsia lituseburensis]|uniref:LytR/AlgR family response regulator transcription factor n=1 Tax=Romboutsia lituseburensis TaxID=1537 RepID=UPI00215AA8E1|nr:LytTR family DNA-binding domain-containing protein [Romboutsia lituseburensis]MCR8746296.1 LytTR family DNA-binding domain-containing protein [Romboutsia lituseburensis]
MIKIAICDDEEIYLNNYYDMMIRIKKIYGYDIDVLKFYSGDELINTLSKKYINVDIIFLDIIMKGMNGIETAKKIRELNITSEIIFLTNSKEYALEGYDVKAFNYIIKNSDNMEDKIKEAIKYSYEKLEEYFIISNQSGIEKIRLSQIVYIESNKRKIIINTLSGKYETYEKLKDSYQTLKYKGFLKCHRSYIVNQDFIKKIESKDIVTSTGERVPISRSKIEEIKYSFMDYLSG